MCMLRQVLDRLEKGVCTTNERDDCESSDESDREWTKARAKSNESVRNNGRGCLGHQDDDVCSGTVQGRAIGRKASESFVDHCCSTQQADESEAR
jgi:hypothetical protein